MLRILGIAILALAAGGGYYGYTTYYRATTVTTSVAISAPVSEAIYGTGTVEPARWAKVLPLQRRRLVDLCTCEGQTVKAGQVLGRQDDAEERNALTQLQISSQQAQRDLDRAEKDRTKSDATQNEYEQRWTQAEEYKSRIAAQQVRIDQLVLRAPLDGMVLRRDGEVGEIVGPTDVLFWVGPPLPMQVVAEVNEEEINRIAVSQKAFLRSEAFPGQALRASVSQITPKGDPTRKTFRVYLLLPNDTPLRIGMSVEANIIFREKPSAIVVPAEAVAGDAVQIVNNGRIERLPVKVGIRGSRNVEVIGDVSRGMAVLSPARPDLADGTRVRPERGKQVPAPDDATSDSTPSQTQDNATVASTSAPASTSASTSASAPASAPRVATADPDNAVISTAISAHIDSVVNDARRNVSKFGR
jgi:RND family efflux transporter MFP subunit